MLKALFTAFNDRLNGILKKRSSEWPKVEKEFRVKHPVCEACGSSKNLNVHHKKPFHLYPELELEPSNLITLCMDKECHLKLGHGGDWKAYNPHVVEDVDKVKKDINMLAEAAQHAEKSRLFE